MSGTIFAGPVHIGNYFFFTYLPNVQALKAETPKIPEVSKDYLAYVEFTGNGWGEVKNIITSGFTSFLTVYNNTVYALWRPTANSSASYLLSITPNGKIISNVSLHVINASYLFPVTNDVGIIENFTPLIIYSFVMSFFHVNPFPNIQVTESYYIVNLTNGNIISDFPEYDNTSPLTIPYSGNGLILASYFANNSNYLVLYSSLGKIVSEKSFKGVLLAAWINGSYIIVKNSSVINGVWENEFRIYNYNWTLLYSYYFNVSSSSGIGFGKPVIVNSSLEYIVFTFITKVINQTLKEYIGNITIGKVPIPLNVTTTSTTTTETTTTSSTINKTTPTTNASATITTTSSSKATPSSTNSKLIEITLFTIVIIVVIGAIAYLIKRRK